MKEKSAVWDRKKLILGGIIASLILIISVSACVFALTPSDDKTDKKETTETVVLNDDDTKDTTTEPTSSEEDKGIESEPEESKPTENKPVESEPEDTSSEQKPVTSDPQDTTSKTDEDNSQSMNTYTNPDSIVYIGVENLDSMSNCELKVSEDYIGFSVSKVKSAYLEMRGFETSESHIIYMQFMKLFDDGTLVFRAYHKNEEYDNTKIFYYIDDFEYSTNQRFEIRIYKNDKCYSLNSAYRKGIISQNILDEIYENYIKDKNNNIFYSYPGFIGTLDFETAKNIKEEYAQKRNGTASYVTFNHINTLKNGIIVMIIERTDTIDPSGDHPIVVEMGEYVYAEQVPYRLKFYKNGEFYSLKEAYEGGIITDDMLDEIFVKVK